MIGQLIFAVCFAVALFLFSKNAQQIYRNIKLGRPADRSDRSAERWKMMLLVAFGQKKMFKRIFPQSYIYLYTLDLSSSILRCWRLS